jgi:tetratricopeptide (TPR) repeat protein
VDWAADGQRLDPTFAEPHYNLGLIPGQQGRPEDAARHSEAALRIKPDSYPAHNHLGRMLSEQGEARGQPGPFPRGGPNGTAQKGDIVS